MEEQIVSAIQIAWEPSADQTLKKQAFEYVNQLRQEAAAWRPCLSIFSHVPRHPEVVRVFCLQIVNNAVQAGIIDVEGLKLVKDEFMSYLQKEYKPPPGDTTSAPDSPSIENKIAQTITFLFCALYETGWQTFFDDLLNLTTSNGSQRDNLLGAAFYLRVVNSIHDEIGDQLVSRSRPEQDRANTLKDLIRARDVTKIARSFQEILSFWKLRNGTIGELSMKAVGKWVSWIDISLIVNEEMLQLTFEQVEQTAITELSFEQEKARDSAVGVFTEIVSKKMPAADKINMIAFMNLLTMVRKLAEWPILSTCKSSIYDVDLAEMVAKLVNVTVMDIVRALDSEEQTSDTWRKAETMMQDFIPYLNRYFSDDYDDVCNHVLPAMTDLLAFVRKAFRGPEMATQRSVMLFPILAAILKKSRIDDYAEIYGEYDGDNTEEAEFIELRKKLSGLQQQVALADEQLYIDVVSALIISTFGELQEGSPKLNWRDLDLALHEMYLLGDHAVKSGGLYLKNKSNSPAAEKLIGIMLLMVEANPGNYDNAGVQIQYMEICVRYSSFFEKHQQYLQPTLQTFIQLAHAQNARLKQRAWYLLMRLIRQQKQHVGSAAEMIIPNLQDLLVVKAELPKEDGAESSDEDESSDTTFSSQLFLFETIGCLLGINDIPVERQIHLAQAVMQPVFTDIQNNIEAAKSAKLSELQVHHDIMALGNIAKGYHDWPGTNPSTMTVNAPQSVKDAFTRVSEVTLVALESLKSSAQIRSAARFTFARLIGMAGQQMMQQLPRWVDSLLTDPSRDEMAQLLRTLDQITFGFKTEISGFLDTIFGTLLQRVLAGIQSDANGTDAEIELAELKREYINFLLVLLGNELSGVLVSSTNQQHFETVISMIEHFTKDPQDLTTAKMALSLLARMSVVWGGPDIIPGQIVADAGQEQLQALPGFAQFMIQRFSPLCWALPSTNGFNAKDGQARMVLIEAAGLQKTIYAKAGQDYLTYLRNNELPGIGLSGPMLDEFLNKLAGTDMKTWRSWFAKFVSSGGAT